MTPKTVFGMSALGGLFGAIGNIASTAISTGVSSELARENREWNEKMWNMQNAYNTPMAQMQRLKEAGLNPNLAYGQLASSNAGSVGSADVYGNKEITQALSKLNIAEASASIAKTVQEIKKTKAETQSQEIDNDLKSKNLLARQSELEAMERYSLEHSAYGVEQLSHGRHLVREGGSFIWSDNPELATDRIPSLRAAYEQYYYDKLLFDLENIAAGRDLKKSQKSATDAIKTLRQLDIPYLNTRNRWQPWRYGIEAGSDILGTVFKPVELFLKFPKRK